MLEAVLAPIKAWAEAVILSLGYAGVALLMTLDAANVPIPSELIMPFAGYLASEGKLTYLGVGLAGTLGSVTGSLISYGLGRWLGTEGLIKYGKWLFIRRQEVEGGERWFKKYGVWVTLWGRYIPLVRTFISLPAGVYRMNIGLFVLFAFLGAAPWCFGWAYVGMLLGQNFKQIEDHPAMKIAEIVVIAALALLILRWAIKRFRESKQEGSAPAA